MKRPAPAPEPEIPAELSMPYVPAKEVADWRELEQGQLVELKDGQHGVLLSVDKNPTLKPDASPDTRLGEAIALRLVRVAWPKDGALPLGQIFELSLDAVRANGAFLVHGAW